MKKVAVIFLIIISYLFAYFLQANLFNVFTISGIMPNLFIIITLVIGVASGKTVGTICGIVSGLVVDINTSNQIGITAISLGVIGFTGGMITKRFGKGSRITMLLLIAFATFFGEALSYILRIIITHASFEMVGFIKICLIECLYNVLIGIIMHPLIKLAIEKLEEEFERKSMFLQNF